VVALLFWSRGIVMRDRPLGWPTRLRCLAAVWGVTAAAAASGQQGPSAPVPERERASFEYRESSDSVVLRYQESLSALAGSDSGRSVVVTGDGRVVVHYPAAMTRAGEYTLRLTRPEMRALLARVVERNFVDLDEGRARQRTRARGAGAAAGESAPPAELFAVFDEATSTIELNLESYRAAGSLGAPRRGVKRNIRFYALRAHAKRDPENVSLQDLAAVQAELMALSERDDLERLP
jgi:hypothetical protein